MDLQTKATRNATRTRFSSRRLQNLAPEQDSLGACFICQDEFRIDQLPRLRRTDCCRVLLHSRCLEEMLNRTSICGNCRQDRTPENTRTLPLDEEEPENSLFGPGTIVFMLRLQRIGFGEIDRYRRNIREHRSLQKIPKNAKKFCCITENSSIPVTPCIITQSLFNHHDLKGIKVTEP